jgi:PAS domain S-box-containing protein
MLAAVPVFVVLWFARRQDAALRRQISSAERLATQQLSFTRAVIDNMVVGLIVVTDQAAIESVNPAAERVFGYASEDLVGHQLGLLIPEFRTQTPAQVLGTNRILEIGGVLERDACRRTGEVFPVEIALYGFPTPNGQRFAVNVRDVSERREVDRLKREFISTVSHELRTPLTSIHGSLRLLSGGVLGSMPADAGDAVRIAERNTARLLTLINDILDWERLAAGETLQLEPVAIGTVIRRSVEAIEGYAAQEGIRIECAKTHDWVLGDSDRLVQVLVNLLSNAVKFSPRGSVVRVAAAAHLGWVEVTVADQGRGIPADQRDLVFERFHQVEGSDSRGRGGTGLGLAICRALVDKHGGAIGVESVEGRGSTFWFRVRSSAGNVSDAAPLALASAT